ncbi:MAG: long-chain fatty acid--CoA ligase [Polyangiaceae bacterium]|nr:long-chain fatty acid--CoA ligase [Polyangiaceae bacterium]
MARDTILDRLIGQAATQPDRPALYFWREGGWARFTWAEYLARSRAFAGALLGLGARPGEAVAIMADNCPEWAMADVGTMLVGGVPAGIYATLNAEQAAYVAGHCEARVVVVDNRHRLALMVGQWSKLPRLERIVVIDAAAARAAGDPRIVSFADFCREGAAAADEVGRRTALIGEDDSATLIYTSGTTGPPKGAMLTHRNLAYVGRVAGELTGAARDDRVVSYLPLSHIAEQVFTIHGPATGGFPVWFARSLEALREALVAARPTVFLGVPRVWEKLRGVLSARLAEAKGPRKRLVEWARRVGLEAGKRRLAGEPLPPALAWQERAAQKLVFDKVRAQLGFDQLRVGITGAAPIGREVLEFFLSLGLPLHEVYGQTEGSGAATFNMPLPGQTRLGTVGRSVPGAEVKLAPDGEILVRSAGVFAGYHKDPAATAETVIDGWLHSGDIGELDADGFLRITDRKKDILITSGGKNVTPLNIELKLGTIEGVGQVVVIGDQRHYLSALLTIDPDRGPALARARGWPEARDELARLPAFYEHVREGVERVNAELGRHETIKRFTILTRDFSQEGGELTPTQKIRRRAVAELYRREIDAMYEGPKPNASSPARPS